MFSSITDKLITPSELLEYLGISRPTLYRLISGRKIPFCKIGGVLRFRKDDIEKYVNDSVIEPLKK